MNIKYVGPVRDYSGYGEANRNDVASLLKAAVSTTVKPLRYTLETADFGPLGEVVRPVENLDIPYDIVILHTTPDQFPNYKEEGKYTIGRLFWETDKIPEAFARGAAVCDEIWTGSEFNANAIKKAGVTKPVYVIPEAIATDDDYKTLKPYTINNADYYKFYSIFEWTERKNPEALLTAYWTEFENTEKVSLTIKTYMDNFTPEKKALLMDTMRTVKRRLGLKRYAPLYVYRNLMDRDQIYRFHKTFDCFVSAHRGEGWGIPQMEALLVGNPIISTNLGGIHEYLRHGFDALVIPNTLVPLKGNSRNQDWYTPDQHWGEIDQLELRKAMRAVFDHQKDAKNMGLNGQQRVQDLFSYEAVGFKMRERLQKIYDSILK